MNAPTHCTRCGQPIELGARFCGACGQQLATAPPAPQEHAPARYAPPHTPYHPQPHAQLPVPPIETRRKATGGWVAAAIVALGAAGGAVYLATSGDVDSASTETTNEDTINQAPPTTDPLGNGDETTPAPKPAQHERAVGDVVIGGPGALAAIVDGMTIESQAHRAAASVEREAYERAAQSGDYVTSPNIVVIDAPERPGDDAYLGDRVTISLPLDSQQRARATNTNVGALYLSVKGPEFIPGHLDPGGARVTIQTGHLSGYTAAVESVRTEIGRIIEQQALEEVNAYRDALADKAIEAAEAYLKQLDSLDGGTKRTILMAVIKQREDIGKMFSASGAGDVQAFNQSLNLVIGKAIVDNVGESKLSAVLAQVTDNADVIAELSEAAGHAAGGDYWRAVEILGKAYSTRTPVYQAVDKTVAALRFVEGVWKEHEWSSAYRAYVEGAPRDYMGIRKAVEPGHWEEIARSYGGIVDYVIRKHPKPDGSELSWEEASELAKRLFDERRARESAAQKERERLRGLLAWLEQRQDNLLLTRLADRAQLVDARGEVDKPATVRRYFALMRSIRRELTALGLPCCDGARMPRDAEDLIYAYIDGGVGEYRAKLADIRSRVAGRLALGQSAGSADASPSKEEPPKGSCPACDALASCCAQVTDSSSGAMCRDALHQLRSRCVGNQVRGMNESCKAMHEAWRANGDCR